MIIFGLTGEIAAGKSLIAGYAKSMLDIKVFDADKVVADLYQRDDVRKHILKMLKENENSDLKPVLKILFKTDPQEMMVIEKYIHDLVEKQLLAFIKKYKKHNIILEIPLLYEAGFDKYCNKIILVTAANLKRTERLKERARYDQELVAAMEARFAGLDIKKKQADYIIDNSGSLEQVKEELSEIFKKERIL